MLPILLVVAMGIPSEGAPSSIGPAATEAKRAADRVLQQPIYHRWELRQKRAELPATAEETTWQTKLNRLQDWLLKYTQWIGDFFGRIVDWLKSWFDGPERAGGSSAGGGFGSVLNWAGWILAAVLVSSVLFILYRLWLTTKLEGSQARVLSRRQIRDALQSGEALAMSSADWLAEGENWKNEQDQRLVYRALYLGLLSGLHSQGRIDFRRNRTNWVYVSRFRGSDDHRSEFASLTSLFDDVWYGGFDAAQRGIEPVREQVKKLLEAGPTHA